MSALGPLWLYYEPDLDGYGGTWHRRWTVTLRLRSHSLSWSFSAGRHREVGW